jgi:hypothetical protein
MEIPAGGILAQEYFGRAETEVLSPAFVWVAMTPVPIIVLFRFLCLGEIAILPMIFLEVPPVRLFLSVIPLVRIVVSPVFVAPGLLVALAAVLPIALLAACHHRDDQRGAEHTYFQGMTHDILLRKLVCERSY